LVIPLAYGLVGKDGQDLLTGTLILDETEKTWDFDVIEEPVLSVNRGFSAIADIDIDYTLAEREHLMQYDSDLFNRYQVGHQYMLDTMLDTLKNGKRTLEHRVL
jgi:aminopeptidase N